MLATRVLAALVFTPAMLAAIWWGGYPLEITCIGLGALMLAEFLQLTLGGGMFFLKAVGQALGLLVLLSTLGWLPVSLQPLVLPMMVVAVFSAALLQSEPLATSVQRAGLLLLGVLYCAQLIAYLALLRRLPGAGLAWAFMALLTTWAADSGAYFVGRALGRHKLSPRIPPSKTVEGALGGLLSSVAAALALRVVLGMQVSPGHAAVLGAIASVLGLVGDLCESMLKRSVGAKDSSGLIPGHGGLLDRFDGVIFVVPAFYLYVVLILGG